MSYSGKMEAERMTFREGRRRTVKEIMTDPQVAGMNVCHLRIQRGVVSSRNPGNK